MTPGALLILGLLAAAQEPSGEEALKANKAAKLAAPFLTRVAWILDYDKAMEESRRAGKPVFAYFTRSYEKCAPCLQLEAGAFMDPAFAELASEAVFYCHITTRIPGEPRDDLLQKLGGGGWPSVMFLDSAGELILNHAGMRSVPAFRRTLADARELLSLRERAIKGDRTATVEHLARQIELRAIKHKDAGVRKTELGALSETEARRLTLAEDRELLREYETDQCWRDVVDIADRVLAQVPGDVPALNSAMTSALQLKDHRLAFKYARLGLRAQPKDPSFLHGAAQSLMNCGAAAPAVTHLKALLEVQPEHKQALSTLATLKPFGMDAFEPLEARFETQGVAVTPLRAAGKERRAGGVSSTCSFVLERDDEYLGLLYDLVQPDGKSEFIAITFEGIETLRRGEKAWTEAELLGLARTIAPSVPHLEAAVRFRKLGLLPHASGPTAEGAKIDPDGEAFKKLRTWISSYGWEKHRETVREEKGALSLHLYAPEGAASEKTPFTIPLVFSVVDRGAWRRSYVLYESRSKEFPHQLWVRTERDTFAVRAFRGTVEADAVQTMLEETERVLPDVEHGRKYLREGEKRDFVDYRLEGSEKALRAALKRDPKCLQAARDLVSCYLAMTDKEIDPAKTGPRYRRAMGAVYSLWELSPDDSVGHGALSVFMYRFNAFPLAVEHLRKAADGLPRARITEIQTILTKTGHLVFRTGEEFELGGFQWKSYDRSPAAGAPETPEGLKSTEKCFVAFRAGQYRFTMAYRTQRVRGSVERDLTFFGFENPLEVRVFPEEPTVDDLKKEIASFLESMK